jgi:choline dehydrogenase
MSGLDLVIRGGTVIDGTGAEGRIADVGIAGDRVVEVGRIAGKGVREIDAEGHAVTPGFIDAHTHMDAQIFWDGLGTNSCWHGITSVVMGNCGFSIAPMRKGQQHLVARNLERAEDISGAAMNAGIDWRWEGFDEYLDVIEALPKGINYTAYVGHSALRTWAMGERAFEEEASEDDLRAMKGQLARALDAGAAGFSTSRSAGHETSDDRPVASRLANRREVSALVNTMKGRTGAMFELAHEIVMPGTPEGDEYFGWLCDLAVESGVTTTFGVLGFVWRKQLAMMEDVARRGGRMVGQGSSRGVNTVSSFRTVMPFDRLPVWSEFRQRPIEAQKAGLADPATRAALEDAVINAVYGRAIGAEARPPEWDKTWVYDTPLPPWRTLAAVAAERGVHPITALIDIALANDLDTFIMQPLTMSTDEETVEVLRDPRMIMTFSDAGRACRADRGRLYPEPPDRLLLPGKAAAVAAGGGAHDDRAGRQRLEPGRSRRDPRRVNRRHQRVRSTHLRSRNARSRLRPAGRRAPAGAEVQRDEGNAGRGRGADRRRRAHRCAARPADPAQGLSLHFDYIIVGGGSAGCVLANRLSEDPKVTVALLEAGPGDAHPYVHMPRGVGKLMAMPSHMYHYRTQPEAGNGQTPDMWLRGKVLGGSSSVNGMVWVRGQPGDWDDMAAAAGDDWSWQHIARAYETIEHHQLGPGPARGGGGPLRISLPTWKTELTEAINQAGAAMGWPIKEDVNAPDDGEGVGYMPRTIWKGKRQSAAVAFLDPVRSRANLTVITGAVTDHIAFDGKRAVGVEYIRNGERRQVQARREVLLCAGAIASPGVLERSGIGNPDVLEPLGIPLIHASPQVGENASEHRAMRMQWRIRKPLSYNRDYEGLKLYWNVIRYYLTGEGPMSVAAIDMRAAFRSSPERNRADIQSQFGLFSWDMSGKAGGSGLEREHGFCAVFSPITPASTGSIHIASRDPGQFPVITANYGTAAQDRAVTVAATRILRRFAQQEPLASLIERETLPGPQAQSDDEILACLDRFGSAGMHTVGSCRMGRDAASVVDPELRVRGVEGLRVMDASVMPAIPAGNTNGPVMAMAWRAAEVIRRG